MTLNTMDLLKSTLQLGNDSYIAGMKQGRALAKSEFASKLGAVIKEGDSMGNAERIIELCGNWVNEP